jgi:hypothetical protein
MFNDYEFLSSPIMGNNFIRSKGKCIYLVNWLKSNIKYVKDLYDEAGNFISEETLLDKLQNKQNWIVEYAIVKAAVKKYTEMFNTDMANYVNIKPLTYLASGNRLHDIMILKSRDYYNIMIQMKKSRSHMESVWSREFDILKHVDIWADIYKRRIKNFPIKKISEFNYKILQNILNTGYKGNKWNKNISANCYCGKLHTPKHLLFECEKSKYVWENISCILKTNVSWKHIVIGCNEYNYSAMFINIFISITSYIIYSSWVKCSFASEKYENVNILHIVRDRLIVYGKILEITSLYHGVGKRIQQIVQQM